jgi:hypothetical protein
MLFEAGRDRSEEFDFVEEPLDKVALAIKERAERGNVDPPRHWFDVGPGAAVRQGLSGRRCLKPDQQERLDPRRWGSACHERSAVMSLALGHLKPTALPLASTRAWIFVVSPPRECPMRRAGVSCTCSASDGPSFCHSLHADEPGSTKSRSFEGARIQPTPFLRIAPYPVLPLIER